PRRRPLRLIELPATRSGAFTAGDPGRRRTGLAAAHTISASREGFDAPAIEPPPHEESLRAAHEGAGPRRAVQAEPEPSSTALRVLDGDGPTVRLGDLAHDRQSETRARHRPRRVRAVEALEQQRPILRGDPGPVVADG